MDMVWGQLRIWKEWGENEGNWVLFRISSVLAGYTFHGHHVLTSHPVKCLFLYSLTVTHPSQPQATTFCKLDQCPLSHSLWWFLGVITKTDSCHTGIKNCFWWSKSGPVPFLKLLPLLWNSSEESVRRASCSSKWQLLLGVSFSSLKLLYYRGAGIWAWETNSLYLKPPLNTLNVTLKFTTSVLSSNVAISCIQLLHLKCG